MRFNIKNKVFGKFLKKFNFEIFKKLFFFISIFYFLVYFFLNLDQISFSRDLEEDSIDIFLSFLFCGASIFLNAFAWKNIVIWFGKKNIKNNLISFYVVTNILKYVPGGIWHFVERFNFLKEISNNSLAFYSILIEPYFMLCASFLLASVGIIYSKLYIVFLIPLIFLNRKLIYFILMQLEAFKSKTISKLNISNTKYNFDQRIKLNSFFPAKALLIETGFVLCKFIGFFICFNTANLENQPDTLFVFVIFCLSWSIGLIIPWAPGGVGVFEACFLFLIGKNVPENIMLVILIYFRLISTSADLFFSVPFFMKKFVKRI